MRASWILLVALAAGCHARRTNDVEGARKRMESELGISVRHVVLKYVPATVGTRRERTVFVATVRELTEPERDTVAEVAHDTFSEAFDAILYEVCPAARPCPEPRGYPTP